MARESLPGAPAEHALLLARRAVADPLGPAVVDGAVALHNRGLAAAVDATRALLESCTVQPGDTVAVHLPLGVESVVTTLACWAAGASVWHVPSGTTQDHLAAQVAAVEAVLLIGPVRLARHVRVPRLTGPVLQPSGRVRDAGARPPQPSEGDFALLLPSQAVPGHGVVLDHGNVGSCAAALVARLGLGPHDATLVAVPTVATAVVAGVLPGLLAGGSVVLADPERPLALRAVLARHRPRCVVAEASAAEALAAALADAELRQPLCVLLVGTGSSPAGTARGLLSREGLHVLSAYGLPEGTIVSVVGDASGRDWSGLPLHGSEVRSMDPAGRLLEDHLAGEVVMRGPGVMRGYLGRPDATAHAVRGAWLHTGDVGYVRDDGAVVLIDRLERAIVRDGQHVYPAQVERVLEAHETVQEAVVLGVDDPALGEVPVAWVTSRPGAAAHGQELLAHCRAALPRQQVPDGVHVLTELPRDGDGAVQHDRLRAQLLDR